MQETSKEKGKASNARRTEKRCLHKRMPHATGPQIPEYHSTDADVNRPSNGQSQKRTKAACLQKILKLMLGKAKRKKALKKENAPEKPRTKNGGSFRCRKLFREQNP